MKRDMDLVRAILLAVESDGDPKLRYMPEIDGHQLVETGYHIGMLRQSGLLDAIDIGAKGDEEYGMISLTWSGHEFLSTIRDPDNWKATKEGAKKVGAWTLPIIQKIAEGVALAKLKALGLG